MAYTVKLDLYEGPLDLLLCLIRKHEINIYDIPIAQITEQYLDHLNLMQALNLDVAGDFFVMAATLIMIKSRMLLPTPPEADEDEQEDPRTDLVQQLLEYEAYRQAAEELREREFAYSNVFWRERVDATSILGEEEFVEVSLFDLMEAFQSILKRLGDRVPQEVFPEEITVVEKINFILDQLEASDRITFFSLFAETTSRLVIIATFLALLELIKLGTIRAVQSKDFGEIYISKSL